MKLRKVVPIEWEERPNGGNEERLSETREIDGDGIEVHEMDGNYG